MYLKKTCLFLGIVFNAGLLFYYKYFDFILQTWGRLFSTDVQLRWLLLPLGISFYTFKAISYLIDVYKNSQLVENQSLIHDMLFLSFFAQIQSGPITRYESFLKQKEPTSAQLFSNGVHRFLIGFNKKVLIANTLSNITSEIFSTPLDACSTAYVWLGSVCYSLQLFFDFAGYSDIAIGISEMFGYQCMENFDYPYMTESVSRFWRRWHISLSEWFRDYIYIPLGGSRSVSKWREYTNLLIVWLLTGFWHGASWNFIVWGLGYFLAISFERLLGLPNKLKTRSSKIIYRFLTLLFINFQWVFFKAFGFMHGLKYIKQMLIYHSNSLADLRTIFLLKDNAFFLVLAILLCFPIVPKIEERLSGNQKASLAFNLLSSFIIAFCFIWALSFIVAGQNNPFVYANF